LKDDDLLYYAVSGMPVLLGIRIHPGCPDQHTAPMKQFEFVAMLIALTMALAAIVITILAGYT
jgi:hypothetical protein